MLGSADNGGPLFRYLYPGFGTLEMGKLSQPLAPLLCTPFSTHREGETCLLRFSYLFSKLSCLEVLRNRPHQESHSNDIRNSYECLGQDLSRAVSLVGLGK